MTNATSTQPKATTNNSLEDKTILFYDGDCALCSFWVRFCLERDHKKRLFFAPLQGQTAAQLLPVELRQNLHSVILWEKQNLWSKSEAILTALRRIQYAPDLVFMAGLAPRGLLNFIYDWIARNRRRWFGTASDICPLLPVEQQRQILN